MTVKDPVIWDVVEGWKNWPLWTTLGWKDIRLRYRRTTIGPFWQTVNIAIFIGALGFVFSQFWGMTVKSYLPYLSAGVVVWMLIVSLANEGCGVFVSAAPFIKQRAMPYSVFAYQIILRNLIAFAHGIPVFLVCAIYGDIEINRNTLLVIPGLLILSINGVWSIFLLGTLSSRFRDIPNFVSNFLLVVFFVTPIHWQQTQLTGRRTFIVDVNPFHHLIEVVRAPMLGQAPEPLSWIVAGSLAVGGTGLAYIIYRRFRSRIPYWL